MHSIVDGLADEAANPRLKHRAAQLVSMSEIRRINRARGHKKAPPVRDGAQSGHVGTTGLACSPGGKNVAASSTQRRAASSVAQHAREGAKQKPRQGDGAKGAPCIGACRCNGKPTDTIPQSVAQRRGSLAAVDKVTPHVAARQHYPRNKPRPTSGSNTTREGFLFRPSTRKSPARVSGAKANHPKGGLPKCELTANPPRQ